MHLGLFLLSIASLASSSISTGVVTCKGNTCVEIFQKKKNNFFARFRRMSFDGKWRTLKMYPLVSGNFDRILFTGDLKYLVTIVLRNQSLASSNDIIIYNQKGVMIKKFNRNDLVPTDIQKKIRAAYDTFIGYGEVSISNKFLYLNVYSNGYWEENPCKQEYKQLSISLESGKILKDWQESQAIKCPRD